jgi:hypothetical protein
MRMDVNGTEARKLSSRSAMTCNRLVFFGAELREVATRKDATGFNNIDRELVYAARIFARERMSRIRLIDDEVA